MDVRRTRGVHPDHGAGAGPGRGGHHGRSHGASLGVHRQLVQLLSIAPPLVLVCLGKSASTHVAFASADNFMINVLAEGQADIARRFACSGADRFAAGDTLPMDFGLPGVPDAAARVACSMDRVVDGGDHSVLIGRVEAAFAGEDAPLVYCDRSFQRPEALEVARYV